MTEKQTTEPTPAPQPTAAQAHEQAETERTVKAATGARESVKQESAETAAKATEKRTAEQTKASEKAAADNPDHPATDASQYHAPSQPDQASEAEKDAADPAFRGVETEYAPDNEIEATVRQMAGSGATSGEIAAYRADALAKLAE